MRTDAPSLRRSLAAHFHADAADETVDGIATFFAMADAGRYGLGYGPRLDVSELCGSLWSAAGIDAKGVVFLPACVPVRELPWDAERDLHARLRQRCEAARAGILSPERLREFERTFEASLGEALRASLVRTLRESDGLRAGEAVWPAIRYALSTHLLFGAAGHPLAGGLGRLVPLLASAIPGGPTRERARIWYVITG